MRRAIALAAPQVGLTGGNPAVGCVIVSAGETVGEAATAPAGRPHAEETALALAGTSAWGATAYITLEPCGERSGGGLSCADKLIQENVARVVIACRDPSRFASGRGLAVLEAAGIEVVEGVLAEAAAALYAGYKPSV